MDIKKSLNWAIGLALLLSIVSLLVPVWSFAVDPYGYKDQYYYFSFGNYITWGAYPNITDFTSISGLWSEMTFTLTIYILTTLSVIILLALVLLELKQKNEDEVKSKISPILLIAALMAFLSPLLFAFLMPYAMNNSGLLIRIGFWGSAYDGHFNYGPHIGWFLQLASLLLIMVSIIVIYQSKTPKAPNP